METLGRWTSLSVFLLIALNIDHILCQNVGPNYPISPSFQGEPICDCNLEFVNPQLQTNNFPIYPPYGIAPGGPIGSVPDYQRSQYQDGLYTQILPYNQQATIMASPQAPCIKLGPLQTEALQGPCCDAQSGPANNIQRTLLPITQILPQPIQYPVAPLNPGLLPFEMLPPYQGSFSPGILSGSEIMGTPQAQGLDLPSPQQRFSQTDSSSVLNIPFHFTPLVPVNPRLATPCIDELPPQGMALPSPQSSVVMLPFPPSNNQGLPGASLDVFLLEPLNPPGSKVPQMNTIPPANLAIMQAPILEAAQGNCQRQAPVLNPRLDILPENQLGPTACKSNPPFQNSLPVSPIGMKKFPKPPPFPIFRPYKGPLASPFDTTCADSSTNRGSVCGNVGMVQPDSICRQVPIATPFIPTKNISPYYLPNQNVPVLPLASPSTYQPPVVPTKSEYCSLRSDEASVNFLPPQVIAEPCAMPLNGLAPVLPQTTYSVECTPDSPLSFSQLGNIGAVPPLLPILIGIPSCESPCQSKTEDAVPVPINLRINVPAPIIPPPRITIINAIQEPPPAVSSVDDLDFPYPLPPLIIEGRRSMTRSWLPLILVALFANDGGFGGCEGGCCGDTGPIPIPYPIPIPTSNPVIVNK